MATSLFHTIGGGGGNKDKRHQQLQQLQQPRESEPLVYGELTVATSNGDKRYKINPGLKDEDKVSIGTTKNNCSTSPTVSNGMEPPPKTVISLVATTSATNSSHPLIPPTEPFLQYEACNHLSPKLPKCWECRLSPSQRNQRLNIFCRFYAFRKLKINTKGTYSVAGFSETYEANSDDLKVWLPAKSSNQPAAIISGTGGSTGLDYGFPSSTPGLDLKITCLYIFRLTLPYFVTLIKQEEKALEAVSGNSKIAWKRPVEGIREMCDPCQTTLFNRHWVCPKCGFAVCLDCYIGKKRWLESSSTCLGNDSQTSSPSPLKSVNGLILDLKESAIKNILDPGSVNDDFPWLPCTNRQPHEPSKLMATHIIPNIALTEIVQVCEKLVDKYKCHNLLLSTSTASQSHDTKDHELTFNGNRKDLTTKANTLPKVIFEQKRGLKANNTVTRSLTAINGSEEESSTSATNENFKGSDNSRDAISLIDYKEQRYTGKNSLGPNDRFRLNATSDLSSNAASPLSWLADVALSTSTRANNNWDKVGHEKALVTTPESMDNNRANSSALSFDIIDHFQNSTGFTSKVSPFLSSPKNYFKNLTPSNTLDDVITAVIEQSISEPINDDIDFKNYRNYCLRSNASSEEQQTPSPPSTNGSVKNLNSHTGRVEGGKGQAKRENLFFSLGPTGGNSINTKIAIKEEEPSLAPASGTPNEPSSKCDCPASDSGETMCTATEQESCKDIPHTWICDGKVLHLQHRQKNGLAKEESHPIDERYRARLLSKFCDAWSRGAPVLVSGIHESLDPALWNPEWFCRAFGQFENDIINCRRNTCIKNLKMKIFWEGFTHYTKRMKDETPGNVPMILKLKDWPSSDDFAEILPKHFKDLSQALPLPEYTQRAGIFNLASRLPPSFVKPDLGPKMYNAYGSANHPTEGSTNLHIDISDATNIMAYVGIPRDEPGHEYYFDFGGDNKSEQGTGKKQRQPFSLSTWQAIQKSGADADTLARLKAGHDIPGAIWHIYKASDVPNIRQFLIKSALETGRDVMPHHDPIHDQEAYLTVQMNERLEEEYGVIPYVIVQCLGDAIFIPAGAPHQVRNLYSCIKVAEDFVSPEHVGHCLKLTEEFRRLSDTHTNHEDKLQIKNIIYHTIKDVCAVLNGGAAEVTEP